MLGPVATEIGRRSRERIYLQLYPTRCDALTARRTRCRGKAVGRITEAGYSIPGVFQQHYVCRVHYERQPRGWW